MAYSAEGKAAVLTKMLPPNNVPLARLAKEEGVSPATLAEWRACARAKDWERAATTRIARETKDDKNRIQQLERELARKEKALAEAAALMILLKKVDAIWGRKEGEDE